jgi:dihydrofolate reductase
MRKLHVITMLTLDGVMQAPGGSKEDTAEGFKYGGWEMPFNDDSMWKVLSEQINRPLDLLLGRKTYEIFAGYWPKQDGEIADAFNKATKYVVTNSEGAYDWEKTVVIKDDVVEKIKKLKAEEGPDLQVHGSANLIQTLLKNNLVDRLELKIYPITLGTGKKLFAEGTIPQTWKMTKGEIGPQGVIYANYESAGEVKIEPL